MKIRIRQFLSLVTVYIILLQVASMESKAATNAMRSPKHPAVPRALVGGIWRVDHTFVATIQVRNVVTSTSVDFTPVIFMADGTEYDLSPMTVPPAGLVEVNINEALRDAPPRIAAHLSSYGSVAVRFTHGWNALDAMIQDLDTTRSLIYRECLTQTVPVNAQVPGEQTVEGLWWKRDKDTDGFIALSNATDSPVQAHLQARGANGPRGQDRVLQIDAHATYDVSLRELLEGTPAAHDLQGGVTVRFHGVIGDVTLAGGMENAEQGFSAPMYFRVKNLNAVSAPQQFAAVGIMMGKQDPMMNFPADVQFTPYAVIGNAQLTPAWVVPRIEYFRNSQEQSVSVPTVRLLPWQTTRIDIKGIMAAQGITDYGGIIHLVLEYTGNPNALIAAAGSVDDSGTYVFDVPVRGVTPSPSKTMYFSNLNGNDTMFTIWNPTSNPQDAILTLHANTGSYKLPIHVNGHESSMFNLSELEMNNIPDVDGHQLSTNLIGTAELASSQGHGSKFTLAIDSGVYNVQTATCGGACDCGVYVTDVFIVDNPFAVDVSGAHQLTATADWSDSSQTNVTTDYAWWSDYGTIISVGNNSGNTSGVAVGSATISFIEDFGSAPYPQCWMYPDCSDKNDQSATSPGTAINLVVQGHSYIFVGSDPQFTIENKFYATTAQPSGGTFTGSSSESTDSFTTGTTSGLQWASPYTTVQSTSANDRHLTFTYTLPDGTSSSKQFNITSRLLAYATNNTPANTCSLGYGWKYQYTYTPYSRPDSQPAPGNSELNGVIVTEAFSPTTIACGNQPGNGNLDGNGQFVDTVAICSTTAIPACSSTHTQTLKIAGYTVRTNSVTISNTGLTYTSQGPTQ